MAQATTAHAEPEAAAGVSPAVMPDAPAAPGSGDDRLSDDLRECPHCGLLQILPEVAAPAAAICVRCRAVLRRPRTDTFGFPLAMATAGLALLVAVFALPFMDLHVLGSARQTTLVTGPVELQRNGMLPLAVLVLVTTLLAPTARLLALAWVLVGLRMSRPPRHLGRVFRWYERLRPWSMVEVFLLGVFVAYTKLVDIARVEVGVACYAMGGLMLIMAAADVSLDQEAIWRALPPLGRPGRRSPPAKNPPPSWVACSTCELVSAGDGSCPRCDAELRRRKPHSLARTWALLLAATALYVPANLLPVLTLTRLGRGQPSTILGGAEELLLAGMWPLALLVFFASITVPVLKIVGLAVMLATTQRGSAWRLRERTRLYRVVEFIGRWSMIDVFMISILTALVHLGFVAQVRPGPGVLAFAAVVILTMLAAACFDPRLMWDAAERRAAPRRTRAPGAARP